MYRIFPLLVFAALCGATVNALAAVDKGTETLHATLKKQIEGHPALEPKVKAFVVKALLPTTINPVWVKAVGEQNARKIPLARIQEIDKQWIVAEEELPIQKELMGSACAKEVVKVSKALQVLKESFVMDDQGANVCQDALTSDYWQGDEAKWRKSFNEGKGGVDVGKVTFDKSANTPLQQVSLPIIGAGGKVIGAVTFGIAVSQL